MKTQQINSTINLDQLLAKRRQIAIIWTIVDVQQVRSDLNADQAWHVLIECKRLQDANEGISWQTIEAVTSQLYPS